MLSLTSLSVIAIRDFWVELIKDGVYNDIAFSIVSTDVSTAQNISLKDAQDSERHEEVLINSFFRAVREDIQEGSMSSDAEIMVVLDMMNHTMKGTDDEHADILSRYLGVRV